MFSPWKTTCCVVNLYFSLNSLDIHRCFDFKTKYIHSDVCFIGASVGRLGVGRRGDRERAASGDVERWVNNGGWKKLFRVSHWDLFLPQSAHKNEEHSLLKEFRRIPYFSFMCFLFIYNIILTKSIQ